MNEKTNLMKGSMMRSILITGTGEAEVRSVSKPVCADGMILVRIEACGICTYEQRIFQGIHKTDYPVVSGHETAGYIEAIGKDVHSEELKVGDRVIVGVTLPCRTCYPCRTGNQQSCRHFSALKQLPGQPCIGSGGFSEYMMVLPQSVFKYYHVSPVEACLAGPLSCVIHSVETADPQFGQTAVVIGAGFMGLLHTLLCVRRGACVIAMDFNEERLELAKKLGACYTLNPGKADAAAEIRRITHGEGADLVFDTTPAAKTVETAFDYIGKLGKIMIYSGIYPNQPIQINPHRIHSDSIQLLGSANSNDRDFVRAAAMISYGLVDMKPFISGIYPAEQAKEALISSCTGKTFRNIITF